MNKTAILIPLQQLSDQIGRLLLLRGGPGSGDWGHSGRPGQVGGSGGGGGKPKPDATPPEKPTDKPASKPEEKPAEKPKPTPEANGRPEQTADTEAAWIKGLSKDQKKSIKYYSQHGYTDIRNCQSGADGCDKETQTHIKNIEEAVKTAPRYEGKVHRGVSFKNAKQMKNFIASMSAGEVEIKSFTSTSKAKKEAEQFAQGEFSVHMQITSKTGVKINNLSDYPGEQEILMPAGAKLKLKAIKESKFYPPGFILEMEEV